MRRKTQESFICQLWTQRPSMTRRRRTRGHGTSPWSWSWRGSSTGCYIAYMRLAKKKKICSPESRIFPVDNSLGKILCVWMYILPGFSEVAQLRNLSPSRAPPCKQPSKMEIQFQTFIQAPGSLIMSIKQLFKVFWVYTLSIFLFLPLLILPNIP